MKALELAVEQDVYVGGSLGAETASELRRLAELNAELLEALTLWKKCGENGCSHDEWENCLLTRDNAIAKAKEQQ